MLTAEQMLSPSWPLLAPRQQFAGKGLMIQGTSSDAGKSLLVAGLCRLLSNQGVDCAPFKPQNMALNSAVTLSGGEIGRSTMSQAQAARVTATVDMNPILLKPESDTGAQVIVHGQVVSHAGAMSASDYQSYKQRAKSAVMDSYQRLCQQFQTVIIEGAGSPAEVNLRAHDLANMGFAETADVPVVLVADIDRGGVFAQLLGTLMLLSASEQQRVVGFIINKFRGDQRLLDEGIRWLELHAQRPVLAVLPYWHGLQLAEEDAISRSQIKHQSQAQIKPQALAAKPRAALTVVVPVLPRMSNHNDFDLLRAHPDFDLQFVYAPAPLPVADLVILPGSKNTLADLAFFREHWQRDLSAHLARGGKVFGICGGLQMLGLSIADPEGLEGPAQSVMGLGLLPIVTRFQRHKTLRQVHGTLTLAGQSCPARGYEIHLGHSENISHSESISDSKNIGHSESISDSQSFSTSDDARHEAGDNGAQQPAALQPLLTQDDGSHDGFIRGDQQVAGSYWHGLFEHQEALQLLANWLGWSGPLSPCPDFQTLQEQAFNRVAASMAEHVNLAQLSQWLPCTAVTPIQTKNQAPLQAPRPAPSHTINEAQ